MKMGALVSLGAHCHPGCAHCTTEWANAWRVEGGSREDFEKEFLSTSRHIQLGRGSKIAELHVIKKKKKLHFPSLIVKQIGKIHIFFSTSFFLCFSHMKIREICLLGDLLFSLKS